MNLPIPVLLDGKKFSEVKIVPATAGIVADTRREVENGALYTALLVWCCGVIETLDGADGSIEDKAEIRRAVRVMPFESAFAVACYGMAETKGDDSIPGDYACPKCGHQVHAQRGEIDGEPFDDTDHLKDLPTPVCSDPEDGIEIILEDPVQIVRRDNNEVVVSVESLILDRPTLGQCIRLHAKYPDDDAKMQFAVYADSLRSVNGTGVNSAWKGAYGELVFNKMKMRDLEKINDALSEYRIDTRKERVCLKCHNRWEASVDLNGFFGSGLKR